MSVFFIFDTTPQCCLRSRLNSRRMLA